MCPSHRKSVTPERVRLLYRREKLFPIPAIELRFLGSLARTFVAVPTQLIPEFTLPLSGTVIQIRDFPNAFVRQTNTKAGGSSR
jgi:hypothetical protein